MFFNKKNLEGNYVINESPNGLGRYLYISEAYEYGDGFILTLISEGKKVKKEVKEKDLKNGDVKLRDLETIEKKGLKWEMPKDLLSKSVDEIVNFMLSDMDIETAKKRLSFYQDRETPENKEKISQVKLAIDKTTSDAEKVGLSVDEIIEFINDNKELPVSDIFKGIQALIDQNKLENKNTTMGDNDPVPAQQATDGDRD